MNLETVYKQLALNDRHFNQMAGTVRAIASAWLLASFVGMGFVLTRDLKFGDSVSPELLVVLITAMTSLGVTTLWIVDLRVYQTLLHANFSVGLRLEFIDRSLPPIRATMVTSIHSGRAVPGLSTFYAAPIAVLLVIGVVYAIVNGRIEIDEAAIGVPFALLVPASSLIWLIWYAYRTQGRIGDFHPSEGTNIDIESCKKLVRAYFAPEREVETGVPDSVPKG